MVGSGCVLVYSKRPQAYFELHDAFPSKTLIGSSPQAILRPNDATALSHDHIL